MIFHKSNVFFLVSLLWALLVAAPTLFAAATTLRRPPASREPPCTGSFNWLSPKLNPLDCAAAIRKLWETDVVRYGNRELEFFGTRTRPRTGLRAMVTPRRYIAGTCTVVIAMLDIFPPSDLPEPPRPPFWPSDITSFHELYQAATSVHLNCLTWLKQAGYQQEGVADSIAVLLMATGSYEDRFIPRGVVPGDKPGAAVADSNGTSSSEPMDITYRRG
ncbi:MAG: hypothetical protein Q9208_003992 [Pyrenodesmia sp. 3 TL-2023]